jgi:hypothetical protein
VESGPAVPRSAEQDSGATEAIGGEVGKRSQRL